MAYQITVELPDTVAEQVQAIATAQHQSTETWLTAFLLQHLRDLNHPADGAAQPTPASTATPQDLGWPPGFFEQTFGAWQGEPLERGDQGVLIDRELLQ